MPDQPAGIQQRIAEILTRTVKFACTCGCGERSDCTYGHANHVAEVLVSELGLTKEFGSYAAAQLVSRYVTEWVAE
jgi:predicted cobalt transporter CbtA